MGTYHRTHKDLANAISPASNIRYPAQVSEDVFVAYESLFILSRRSRYLYNPKAKAVSNLSFTFSKHLAKAVRHLNTIIEWFDNEHSFRITENSFYMYWSKKR